VYSLQHVNHVIMIIIIEMLIAIIDYKGWAICLLQKWLYSELIVEYTISQNNCQLASHVCSLKSYI